MRRIILFVPLALLSACVVRPYTRPAPVVYEQPPPVAVQEAYYQYNGPHPVPDAEGGGWCDIEGVHTHPFAPAQVTYYRQTPQRVYIYSGPRTVWYYGFHPVPGGGYCYLGGRHSHGYLPAREYRSSYVWTPGQRYYRYRGTYVPPNHVHSAVGVQPPRSAPPPAYRPPAYRPPPAYRAPPPASRPPPPGYRPPVTRAPPPAGRPPYTPPSSHTPPGNRPPSTPPGHGSPPPGHGGQIPGHGGTPPGQGHNGPPGHQNNPGHGGYDPGPNPPGHDSGHGRGNDNGHGRSNGHGRGHVVKPVKRATF